MSVVRSLEGPQNSKIKKIKKNVFFSKRDFPKLFPSSHISVNSPQKTLNLRPLNKISLKTAFWSKKVIFCEIFPGHFFQKYDLPSKVRPALRKIGGRAAKSPLSHCTLHFYDTYITLTLHSYERGIGRAEWVTIICASLGLRMKFKPFSWAMILICHSF